MFTLWSLYPTKTLFNSARLTIENKHCSGNGIEWIWNIYMSLYYGYKNNPYIVLFIYIFKSIPSVPSKIENSYIWLYEPWSSNLSQFNSNKHTFSLIWEFFVIIVSVQFQNPAASFKQLSKTTFLLFNIMHKYIFGTVICWRGRSTRLKRNINHF